MLKKRHNDIFFDWYADKKAVKSSWYVLCFLLVKEKV